MAKMIRYFHIRHNKSPKGGATVRVEADTEGGLEQGIIVTRALCSPNDQFCRAAGRKVANDAQYDADRVWDIPLKGLPAFLRKTARMVLRRQKGLGQRSALPLWNQDFGFATKYWLPPEVKNLQGNPPTGAPALLEAPAIGEHKLGDGYIENMGESPMPFVPTGMEVH